MMSIAVLAVIIMAWGRISKSLDWTGARIGETGDMLSDLTVSGSKQTARGVLISDGSLEDTFLDEEERAQKRIKRKTSFVNKLTDDEKKSSEANSKRMREMIKRK